MQEILKQPNMQMHIIYVPPIYDTVWFGGQSPTFRKNLRLPSSDLYCTLLEVLLNLTEVFLALTEVYPCFFLICKANARVKLANTGHGSHSSILVVICVFLCIVCKCVLPPSDKPIAVNKYIRLGQVMYA
jgi:hypothetical protein